MLLLLYFLYIVYFGVVTSDKILFSCISMSSLSRIQRFFSKMKLVKILLRTELKQTNLENRLHISTERPKENFIDTVLLIHFIDELKHCNSDMRMDLQLLVSMFLCLYSISLVARLSFRIIFFRNLFCFISSPCEFAIF